MNVAWLRESNPYRYDYFNNKDPRLCVYGRSNWIRWNQKYDVSVSQYDINVRGER